MDALEEKVKRLELHMQVNVVLLILVIGLVLLITIIGFDTLRKIDRAIEYIDRMETIDNSRE